MTSYVYSFVRTYYSSSIVFPKKCYRGIVLSLLESIIIGMYYYLSIYFTDVLRMDISIAGLIISFYGLGAIFGGYLGGKLSDYISSQIVIVIAMIMQAIVYFSFTRLISTPFLVCNVFILGLVTYAFITSNYLDVLSNCRNEDERLKAINILSATSNLGLAFSAIFMSRLILLGFRQAFFFIVCALIGMVAFALHDVKKKTIENEMDLGVRLEENFTSEKVNHSKYYNEKQLLLLALFCVFLVGLIVAQIGSNYAIYIKEKFPQHGINAVSFLFAMNAIVVVMFSVPIGAYIGKYNKLRMVGIGALFIGLGMCVLTLSNLFIMAVLACVIYTVGEIIFFSVAQLVCYQSALQNTKGKIMGAYRMVYALSRVLGPGIGGVLYPYFGGDSLWYLSGVVGLFCFLICNIYLERN